jgi:hypothetical protein
MQLNAVSSASFVKHCDSPTDSAVSRETQLVSTDLIITIPQLVCI